MSRYRHLDLREREEFSRMLAANQSVRRIAYCLRRAPSSLTRELQRHRASRVTYRAVLAQHRAQRWAAQPRKPHTLAVTPRLRTVVFRLLAQHWSPEQCQRPLEMSSFLPSRTVVFLESANRRHGCSGGGVGGTTGCARVTA